jgi:pimeloyl-ACP methyl ester carboxylesterase
MSLTPSPITAEQVDQANATGRTPVVFIHGLWLLPSSWDRWATVFEEAGYSAVTPGWPDDPETVEEANANPEVFAHKTIGQVADHFAEVIGRLEKKPAVIGHSFGGLRPALCLTAGSTDERDLALVLVFHDLESAFAQLLDPPLGEGADLLQLVHAVPLPVREHVLDALIRRHTRPPICSSIVQT